MVENRAAGLSGARSGAPLYVEGPGIPWIEDGGHTLESAGSPSLESLERKLRDLLEVPFIDENAAMAQAERIAELEGRMKRLHLRLLIRINNNLTHDQQEALRTIVHERPHEGPALGRGPGPRGPEVPFN